MRRHDVPPALAREPFATSVGYAGVGRGCLDGPAYCRVVRGARMVADGEVSHGRRIQGARVVLGPRAVLVGPSAAWVWGSRLPGSHDLVHVAGPRSRRRDGVVVHRTRLDPGDVVSSPLGLCTGPARTAVDLARGVGTSELSFGEAVAWLDDYLRVAGLPVARARQAFAAAAGLHGRARAHAVLSAARDGVGSVKETELRLLVTGQGLPEPEVQCLVMGPAGRPVAKLDLGWARYRVGIEYDGAVHRQPRQHSLDLARHNRIRRAGWVVLQVDARGLRRPDELLTQLRVLLRREGGRVLTSTP